MILSDSEPKVTGLQLTQLAVQRVNEPSLTADYVLVSTWNTETKRLIKKQPHPAALTTITVQGLCKAPAHCWSAETLAQLTTLIESMEKDLIKFHFMEGYNAERFEVIGDDEAPQV